MKIARLLGNFVGRSKTQLFSRRNNNTYVLHLDGKKVLYSTGDEYSRQWFYPRYDGGKVHEPVVTKMIADSLKHTKVFADVGAHLGYYTCLAGKVLSTGIIYGFEMDKNVLNLLKNNIKLNKLTNVKVFNYAVSDNYGLVRIPKSDTPNASLSLTLKTKSQQKYTTVKSISLDSFFQNRKNKPDVVKIDVEGVEIMVLKGMRKLLNDCDLKLFIELHGDRLGNFSTSSKEIISFIVDCGYHVFEIVNHRNENVQTKIRLKRLNNNSNITYNTMVFCFKN